MKGFTLAIHGGAGTLRREMMTGEMEADYHAALAVCLRAGHGVLAGGGSAVDAVTAAVMALEDDPRFNAGRGSVLTSDGRPEMDAAIMDGHDRAAGAVAGILGPKNPVLAARAVMERSPHVLLMGDGAMRFCREQKLDFMPETWFVTERRIAHLQAALAGRGRDDPAARHGTVGAVARDARGNLAAATSTGGMTAKLPGRVGDCPVIGAGTFADNGSCAVSCTGQGEYFIRWAVAHEISARMRLGGEDLRNAAAAVMAELGRAGGDGGLIAVDGAGNVALEYNSQGMYRGRVGRDGVAWTGIYDEALRPAG